MVRQRKTKTAATVSTGPHDEIPEDEQWRLINESGVLKQLQTTSLDQTNTVDDSDFSLAEEIFDAAIYIIPISFLLLLMEILIHLQYGKHPSLNALTDRMLPGVPIISICVFYTTRHKKRKENDLSA
ncbi:hypothetical protein H0H93_007738 [Arthromyces matolae]|nr:hypothetical protein H0H93_007738 [Arthromyces matolae]